MRFPKKLLGFALLILAATFCQAQESARNWDELLSRTEGWLGADGIYSLDLDFDSESSIFKTGASQDSFKLFWFSDTICGQTRKKGAEYGKFQMVNHSFAILQGIKPHQGSVEFFYQRDPQSAKSENIIDGHYWLQDGIRYGDVLWISAILVGNAWKPERVDAVTIAVNPETGLPDFSDIVIDDTAPLSFKTDDEQVVWGAAINDESEQEYIYIYGYVDRLKERSRKDMVAARVLRESFLDYDKWQYFDGDSWTNDPREILKKKATIVQAVSAEYSVSKIPLGINQGKYLLVYTPYVIGERIAFRVGDTPFGPFGKETVFYKSDVPQDVRGVYCYNAKAHSVFANNDGILVSYNVNRLGELPRKPEEYRPRFVWLKWDSVNVEPSSQNMSEN